MCSLIYMRLPIDFVVHTDGSHRHEALSRWDIQMDWLLHGPLVKVPCSPCPLPKSAAEVALNLQNEVFSYLGTPNILHSDNGHEFVNEIVASLCREWPGEVIIFNGRPRNPKCQGVLLSRARDSGENSECSSS